MTLPGRIVEPLVQVPHSNINIFKVALGICMSYQGSLEGQQTSAESQAAKVLSPTQAKFKAQWSLMKLEVHQYSPSRWWDQALDGAFC